jgi:hypothetical protein
LAVWLNRADEPQRQRFAAVVMRQIERDVGVDADGDPRFDDRPAYRWRHRLLAFQEVVTGDRGLDVMLDNYLAYGLVAGTPEPTTTDLAAARSVLPRLEKHLAANPDQHALHDTVGCVHFVLGDFAKAVTAFEAALKRFTSESQRSAGSWLASDSTRRQENKLRTHLQGLYTRRLDAARANAGRVATGTAPGDPSLLPLPRDLGQPRPEPSAPTSLVEPAGQVP